MPKTTCGQKSTRSIRKDGCMSMPARRHGITRDSTRKDGARRCHTALHSLSTAPLMSPGDMYGRANIPSSGPDVLKKSCYTSYKRSRTSEDRTWARMSDSALKRRTRERTANCAAMSSLPSPRPSPNSCLAPRQLVPVLHHNPPDEHPHHPTTRRHPPKCPGDRVETPNGSLHAAKMEGDHSSSLPKTPRADLLSLERSETRASKDPVQRHSTGEASATSRPNATTWQYSRHLVRRASHHSQGGTVLGFGMTAPSTHQRMENRPPTDHNSLYL